MVQTCATSAPDIVKATSNTGGFASLADERTIVTTSRPFAPLHDTSKDHPCESALVTVTAPTEAGIVPACRALIAPIEAATGKQAYYIGKPNPLIMRHALKSLETHRVDAAIIGDRMDTDIIAGIESEVDTVLVLSGVSDEETVSDFPYRPTYIMRGVGSVIGLGN